MKQEKTIAQGAKGKRSPIGTVFVGALCALATLYLFNPGLGIWGEIPDNIPVVGNLDETAAAALLISCLAYFGIDIGGLFGRKSKKDDVIDVEVQDR